MKEAYTNIYNMQEKEMEYNATTGYSATIELFVQDNDFCIALYNRKIKNIKLLYDEEPNWQEKEKKKKIKEIKKSIKKLQQELESLESEVN